MITFLDLLIIVSLALIAASFLAVVLMFLIKNEKVRRVCFYITVVLSLYIATVGIRINWLGFESQAILAAALALVSVGALVLSLVKKDDDRLFLIARIAAAVALVVGVANALLI